MTRNQRAALHPGVTRRSGRNAFPFPGARRASKFCSKCQIRTPQSAVQGCAYTAAHRTCVERELHRAVHVYRHLVNIGSFGVSEASACAITPCTCNPRVPGLAPGGGSSENASRPPAAARHPIRRRRPPWRPWPPPAPRRPNRPRRPPRPAAATRSPRAPPARRLAALSSAAAGACIDPNRRRRPPRPAAATQSPRAPPAPRRGPRPPRRAAADTGPAWEAWAWLCWSRVLTFAWVCLGCTRQPSLKELLRPQPTSTKPGSRAAAQPIASTDASASASMSAAPERGLRWVGGASGRLMW